MIVQITREADYAGPRSIKAPSAEVREEYESKCQSCGLCCCHPLTKAAGPSDFTYHAAQEVTTGGGTATRKRTPKKATGCE